MTEKTIKCDYLYFKNIYATKYDMNKDKLRAAIWKIFAIHLSDKDRYLEFNKASADQE